MEEDTIGENELIKIFPDFFKQQQSQLDLETKNKIIASKAASIVHCDGKLFSQTRNYLYDIDLLLLQFI